MDDKEWELAKFKFTVKTPSGGDQPVAIVPWPVHKGGTALKRRLSLRMRDDEGAPHANCSFELIAGGTTIAGSTGPDGALVAEVPAGAASAELTLQTAAGPQQFVLQIGLAKADDPRGAQQRLQALGYEPGAPDAADAQTQAALRAFQAEHKLGETGKLDADTAKALDGAFQKACGA